LTQATVLDIHGSSRARHLGVTMMLEAQTVASRLGISIPGTPQERLARATQVGAVRPSMLQDVQAGRPLEIEALLGAIVELAGLAGTPIPSIAAVYSCAQLLNSVIVERKVRLMPQSIA
jgi:2-dehydropantoate 2-reductase